MLLELYKSKATNLLSLYRNGDVTYEEFFKMKDDLIDINNISEQINYYSSDLSSATIIETINEILSVIK